MSIPKWKIKGIVDDSTVCGCCGRRGLGSAIAMVPLGADGNEDGAAEDGRALRHGEGRYRAELDAERGHWRRARCPGRVGPA
ncbi:hypothetical protein [Streptomyces cadmiisoli]|uniref:hypothetical protein n=1 Tax=Streptomyces cadmiisoli TaxID=2184053 RepID=UPI003D733214